MYLYIVINRVKYNIGDYMDIKEIEKILDNNLEIVNNLWRSL